MNNNDSILRIKEYLNELFLLILGIIFDIYSHRLPRYIMSYLLHVLFILPFIPESFKQKEKIL